MSVPEAGAGASSAAAAAANLSVAGATFLPHPAGVSQSLGAAAAAATTAEVASQVLRTLQGTPQGAAVVTSTGARLPDGYELIPVETDLAEAAAARSEGAVARARVLDGQGRVRGDSVEMRDLSGGSAATRGRTGSASRGAGGVAFGAIRLSRSSNANRSRAAAAAATGDEKSAPLLAQLGRAGVLLDDATAETVTAGRVVGEGAFGTVVGSDTYGLLGTTVVIKTPKLPIAPSSEEDGLKEGESEEQMIARKREELKEQRSTLALDSLAEAALHASITKHPNIARLKGVHVRDIDGLQVADLYIESCPGGKLEHDKAKVIVGERYLVESQQPVWRAAKAIFAKADKAEHVTTQQAKEGLDAARKIKELTPLIFRRKINIIRGVIAGVVHLHKQNIIHRDLAARNLLATGALSDDGVVVKVSDFGMARQLKADDDFYKPDRNVGAVKWMAPESIMDGKYTKASDVLSMAATILEILMEEKPFGDMTSEEVMVLMFSDPPQNALNYFGINQDNCEKFGLSVAQYQMLKRCFLPDSKGRPSAAEVAAVFMGSLPGAAAGGGDDH